MAITSFSKDTPIDYIPEYSGNRASETPCVVRLRFVPYSKVQEYSRLIAARTKNLADREKAIEISHEIQKRQFTDNVEAISGYFVDGKEVTDPAEFYKTADSDLIIEILKAMENSARLTEGQRKN